MNHSIFGKKLSRNKNERRRLFANLTRDLILHGKIVISKAKAKAVQPLVEKIVTKAKKGTDADRRRILRIVPHADAVDMLMRDAKDRFAGRSSGFTRIVKTGRVRSDAAEEVLFSFVDEPVVREPVKYEKAEKPEKTKAPKEVEKPNKRRKTIRKKK